MTDNHSTVWHMAKNPVYKSHLGRLTIHQGWRQLSND
jgi:hypothetical protein